MNRLTTKLERITIAFAAFAFSTITLLGATVAPASADQSTTIAAKGKPAVEVVMVSLEPAART
ncbi:MAG: hypothetical protein ACHQJ7_07220 [Vicinamibacteria bacterium]|jgi:hypothetical protein